LNKYVKCEGSFNVIEISSKKSEVGDEFVLLRGLEIDFGDFDNLGMNLMEKMEILDSRRKIFNFFGMDSQLRSDFIDELKKLLPVGVMFSHSFLNNYI
jgi:hypothetical protein